MYTTLHGSLTIRDVDNNLQYIFTTSLRSRAYNPSLHTRWPVGIDFFTYFCLGPYLGLHWVEVVPFGMALWSVSGALLRKETSGSILPGSYLPPVPTLLDVTGLCLKIFSRSIRIFRNDIFDLFVTHAHSFISGSLSFKNGFSSSGGSGSVFLFRKVSSSVSSSLSGVSSLLYCSL